MKRRIALGVAVGIAALAGTIVYRQHRAHAPLEWSGTVEARDMELGSRVGGRVLQVLAHEGDAVDAGAPLVLLEPGDLPAQRLQAQGQLEQAQAALARVAGKTLPTARRAEIAAARARLESEEVQQQKAMLDEQRLRKLFASGAATQVDFDNATIALKNASARVDASRAQLDQLLQSTPEDVKAAEGQLDVARGRLEQIDVLLAELTIRSPRPAQVESLDLRPGDLLAPNATAARLLEPGQLYVRIYVPETQLGHIHLGQEVPVFVDSFPGRPFQGQVEFIAREGEFSPRNLQTQDERANEYFAARVRLLDGLDVLRAGMAAFVRVSR